MKILDVDNLAKIFDCHFNTIHAWVREGLPHEGGGHGGVIHPRQAVVVENTLKIAKQN